MPQEYPRFKVPPSPRPAAVFPLAPNEPLRLDPNRRLWKAQDTIVGQARRVLAEYGLMGSSTWAVPAGTVNPSSGSRVYPSHDTWRTVAKQCARQVPGTKLECHVLYCPAGLTQRQTGANFFSAGAWAKLRVRCTWTCGINTSGPHDFELTMEGSNKGDWGGAENTDAGSDWGDLRERLIVDIMPPGFESDPEIGVQFSEWAHVDIELAVLGGERIVHAIVYERPSVYTQAHDESGALTAHGAPQGSPDKPSRPVTDAADGASFESHRWGTHRVLQVLERQGARLGPRLLSFSHANHQTGAWDSTTQWPLAVTGALTLANLFVDSLTGYNTGRPGWIVSGSMAQLFRLHGETNFMRNSAAVVPVRVCIDCEADGTAAIRLQSSTYEWIDLDVPLARGEAVAYGYLASQVYADHFAGILQPLITCGAAVDVSVYNISIEFWEDEGAMSFETLYDVDYADLANNSFADGNETIDGDVWVAGSVAAATSFGVENGTGIHFDATTTSTAFTSTNVTCSRIRIALGDLIETWDPDATYLIEAYFSSLTLGTDNNRVAVALYKDATTDALIATGRENVSGNQRIFAQQNTTITQGATNVTSDTFAMVVDRSGARCLHGTYDTTNDAFPALAEYTDGGWVPSPHVADFSLMSTESFLMLSFVTGEAGGAMDAVLRRVRIRKITG